jgi:Mrp family chromosome partitioning ATPase
VTGEVTGRSRRSPVEISASWRTQLERVITRLYVLPEAPKPRVLTFLGGDTGAGSRSICAHSSELLASRVSMPVCLVETNPSVKSMLHTWGLPSTKTLADLLLDPASEIKGAVVQTPCRNLSLLGGGLTPSEAGFLCYSDRLPHVVKELRARFEYVLIDAPPLGSSNDSITLAELSDASVLVLPASGLSRSSAREWTSRLEEAGVRLYGVILHEAPS